MAFTLSESDAPEFSFESVSEAELELELEFEFEFEFELALESPLFDEFELEFASPLFDELELESAFEVLLPDEFELSVLVEPLVWELLAWELLTVEVPFDEAELSAGVEALALFSSVALLLSSIF